MTSLESEAKVIRRVQIKLSDDPGYLHCLNRAASKMLDRIGATITKFGARERVEHGHCLFLFDTTCVAATRADCNCAQVRSVNQQPTR